MGAPLRVLIIDDNEAIRMILTDMLTDLGHTVVAEADSAEAAQKAYVQHKPDLVTLDLSLSVTGGGDGLSVLKALQGIDSRARIIIISGNSQNKVKSAVEAAGAVAFVSKPIGETEFAAAVAKALQS
jgi:two-component system chemotaxis response regulator CheY